ncbi:hypothetical protein [Streptomyces minutiscleroticus]|nr:hypothetical protein [Streptomyces minutiscleroticus]
MAAAEPWCFSSAAEPERRHDVDNGLQRERGSASALRLLAP